VQEVLGKHQQKLEMVALAAAAAEVMAEAL
jgi:hypothetical protein